jgi:hypothetical protein
MSSSTPRKGGNGGGGGAAAAAAAAAAQASVASPARLLALAGALVAVQVVVGALASGAGWAKLVGAVLGGAEALLLGLAAWAAMGSATLSWTHAVAGTVAAAILTGAAVHPAAGTLAVLCAALLFTVFSGYAAGVHSEAA